MDYKEGELLTQGYISLQAESHPIDFKNIRLLNLCGCKDPKAKNFKSYFIKANNSLCIYCYGFLIFIIKTILNQYLIHLHNIIFILVIFFELFRIIFKLF